MEEYNHSISVCICTYNQAAYLELAIRSVLNQTLIPIEIIVSNDCSTDDSKDILLRLAVEIPILKVINQEKNIGIAKNVDACLRMASGEFIVRLDSDDLIFPTFLERMYKELLKYPTAGYGHAAVIEIDEQGVLVNKRKLFRVTGFHSEVQAIKATLKGYRVAANILMFRKQALEKVDYLMGRPNFGEDYHLTADISRAGYGNVYIDDTLAFYRVWSDSDKLRQKRKLAEIKGLQQVFDDVIEPAFKERKWSLLPVNSSKRSLACSHSDCLSWKNYSNDEKKELVQEIRKLSTSYKVELFIWMYLNGYGYYFNLLNSIQVKIKSGLKTIFLKLSYSD
jgi:glycosyltransferase involved in cell wall biosynthesis